MTDAQPAIAGGATAPATKTDISFDDAFDELTAATPAVDADDPDAAAQPDKPTSAPDSAAPAAATAAPAAQVEDIWANVPDVNRKAYEALKAKHESAERAASSYAGRASAAERKLHATTTTRPAPVASTPEQAAKLERWKQMETDYPDIAAGIDERVAAAVQGVEAKTQQALKPLAEGQHRAFVDAQKALLTTAHPDWANVVQTPEFNNWLSTQPPEVQAYMDSDYADRASYLIGNFKTAVGTATAPVAEIQARRASRVAQATAVSAPGRTAPNVAVQAPDEYSAAWDFADRQEQTRRANARP